MFHGEKIDGHGALPSGGGDVEVVSGAAEISMNVPVNVNSRSGALNEIAKRGRADVLAAIHSVESSVGRAVRHQ